MHSNGVETAFFHFGTIFCMPLHGAHSGLFVKVYSFGCHKIDVLVVNDEFDGIKVVKT